jgi:hypothetical protein
MTRHTPGPWHVGTLPPPEWRYVCSDNGDTIAAVAEWDGFDLVQEFCADQARANARLIAAAPDMLAALNVVAAQLDDIDNIANPEACKIVLAAIAKATGAP